MPNSYPLISVKTFTLDHHEVHRGRPRTGDRKITTRLTAQDNNKLRALAQSRGITIAKLVRQMIVTSLMKEVG